jgi:hypothetical protein
VATDMSDARRPWSRFEVEAVVADYFQMLRLELAGQKYNKSAHRNVLLAKLESRSPGSVELKHQNISAILLELGAPWIEGYKPMGNYQQLLFDIVEERLLSDVEFDAVATSAVERPAVMPEVENFAGLIVSAPVIRRSEDKSKTVQDRYRRGVKRDYLALEQHNRALGKSGEEYVLRYEQYRLNELGAGKLADRIEHVASTRGDGLGFDVLSFESNGMERLIEVKTTSFGLEAPFYISRAELDVSREKAEFYQLYRLFDFRDRPRMYQLKGPVDQHCILDPVSYRARF